MKLLSKELNIQSLVNEMINQNYFPTFFKGNDESRRKKEFLVRISNKMAKLAEKEKERDDDRQNLLISKMEGLLGMVTRVQRTVANASNAKEDDVHQPLEDDPDQDGSGELPVQSGDGGSWGYDYGESGDAARDGY